MKAMLSGVLSATACPLDITVSKTTLSRNLLLGLRRASSTAVRQSYRIRQITCTSGTEQVVSGNFANPMTLSAADLHTERAWKFWRKLGSPKYHVAPMVDQVPILLCFLFTLLVSAETNGSCSQNWLLGSCA